MKKAFMFFVVCFLAFGVSLKASASARIDGMNSNDRITEDYDLIFAYPNKVTEYKNTVDIRFPYLANGNSDQWGGFLDGGHTGLGVIGVYVYRPNGFDGYGNWETGQGAWWNGVGGNKWVGITPSGDNYNLDTPENKVDIFWGDTVAENTTFGIQINYADNTPNPWNTDNFHFANESITTTDPGATFSKVAGQENNKVFGANLGLGLKDAGAFSQVNLHAGYFMGSISASENTTPIGANMKLDGSLKDNGISTIVLGALAQKDLDENTNMRFFADGYLDSFKSTSAFTVDFNNDGTIDQNEGGTYEYSQAILSFGLGCNHKIADGRGLVSTGLTANWTNNDTKEAETIDGVNVDPNTYQSWADEERKRDYVSVTWNVSVEGKLADWFTLRAGLSRPVYAQYGRTKINKFNYTAGVPAETETTQRNYDFFNGDSWGTFTLGAGINFGGNWTLDVFMDHTTTEEWLGDFAPGDGILYSGDSMAYIYGADLKFKL